MKRGAAELLLAFVLAVRGSSLLFSKIAMTSMGFLTLLGFRFLIAFAILAVIFRKRLAKATHTEILHSALLGVSMTLMMVFELAGLRTTPSSTTAFIENSAVLFVPFLAAVVYRKRPDKVAIISAIIALIGIAFLTLKGDHLNFTLGEFLVLMGGFMYAVTVIITDVITAKDDAFIIGMLQLFFVGIYGLVLSFFFEDFHVPSSGQEWIAILYLAIVCSAIGFSLQPVAQKYTSAERAGLFVSFNPLAATLLGVLFLNESFSWSGVLGAMLILGSVLYSSWHEIKRDKLNS